MIEGPIYADRAEAGRALAERLAERDFEAPVVLALPRGGVPVALEVALVLKAPIDLVLVRKIGVPYQPELAVAAVVDGGHPEIVVNKDVVALTGLSQDYIDAQAARELEEIDRRRKIYLGGRARAALKDRTAIVIDDGIATGASVRAALRALRGRKPKALVLAVPVAPAETIEALRPEVDDIVCLHTPMPFYAIGVHYRDFHQVPDDEVVAMLAKAGAVTRTVRAPEVSSESCDGSDRQIDYDKALLDPGAIFASLEEVIASKSLTRDQMIEILRRWVYDAAELSVAEEEGMSDGDGELMRDITRALDRLTGGLDLDHSPPTKHGGIERRGAIGRSGR